jgi:hypothetical protein
MYRGVVRRRMKIRGGKRVVEKVRIIVMGMRSVLSEMYFKNNYVEFMAEKSTYGNGRTGGWGFEVVRSSRTLK